MAACKHVWQGGPDGVTCKECGKHLSHEEYLAELQPAPTKRPAAKKTTSKKK